MGREARVKKLRKCKKCKAKHDMSAQELVEHAKVK